MKGSTALLALLGLGFLAARKSPPSSATPPPSYAGGSDALPSQSQADAILHAPSAAAALAVAANSNIRIVNNPEVAAANRAAGLDENGFPVNLPHDPTVQFIPGMVSADGSEVLRSDGRWVPNPNPPHTYNPAAWSSYQAWVDAGRP